MENNKIIAEFMGLQDSRINDKGNGIAWGIQTKNLKYNTSWDWLMPVANEIIKSRDEQNADWDLTNLKYALQTTNIELVHNAVVGFIKEHNN